ncbi:MAG: hypothetical protein WA930_01085 [Rhodanobacter sp.]
MQKWLNGLIVVSSIALYGCAGAGSTTSGAQQQQLQSLQLFAANDTPRFALYVACTSDSVNCVNVGNAVFAWARDHDVTVHNVDSDDPAFTATASRAAEIALPYRVAIDYRPSVVPGYSASSYKQSSESFAPTVGYRAVISVFQAATGKLLMRSPVRNQQAADHGKTSNPYVRSQMIELLDSLEPSAKDSR